MTVKEIFELRKQGKIEEAYDAIRPMYREHKGRYTTLCMFWTASDIFKLRLDQKRVEEASKIYQALQRLVPSIEDKDGRVSAFMHYASSRLDHAQRFSRSATVPDGSPSGETECPAVPPQGCSDPLSCMSPCPGDHLAPQTKHSFNSCDSCSEENNPSHPSHPCSKEENSHPRSKEENSHPCSKEENSHPCSLNAPQQKVLAFIRSHPGITVPKLNEGLSIPSKSLERHIAALKKQALIDHRGSKKTGGYYAK